MSRPLQFRFYIAAFFVIVIVCLSSAQQNSATKLQSGFEAYAKSNLQEKIFVHTDRDFYLTGELIWFKIYCLEGASHRPLPLDKVAYVELVDRNKLPVLQMKVAIDSGRGCGSLFIPASLNSDVYTLRVYTQWMKNYNPDFYFGKSITVVNPFNATLEQTASAAPQLEVAFFPEGGNLIAGVKNKVAVRVSESGRGVDATGVVVNQRGDTLSKFTTLKFGLGNFTFVPSAAEQYKAITTDQKGKKLITSLPTALVHGFGMFLQEESGEITVTVAHGANKNSDDLVYLFVHSRQVNSKVIAKSFSNGSVVFRFQKSELPDGISHLTVFDEELKPQCERLYFKKPKNELSLQLATNRLSYSTREKITLSLQAMQSGNGSIAVARLDSLSTAAPSNIASYIWLQADLAGDIESPEYYFSDDKGVGEACDNLMLTHGWRRFKWDSVLHGSNRKRHFPEHGGHQLFVKVIGTDGVPVANREVFLTVPAKRIDVYPAVSNQQGEANFEIKNFFGSHKIVLQTNMYTDSTSRIELVDPFSRDFSNVQLPALSIDSYQVPSIVKRSIYMQALDIYHRNKIEQFSIEPADSSSFYGTADETYWLDQYTRFPVMEEVMREYVKGVMVRKRKDGFHFIVLNTTIANDLSVFKETPLILLDGVPIFDEDEIMAFDPMKIKKLEVVTREYFLGPKTFPGIVSFKTYGSDLGGFQLNPKSIVLNYEGLAREREFYSPNYASSANKRIPDFRTLLYWKPDLSIDAKSKSLEFYSSDVPGKYLVTVQGVAANGVVGSGFLTFEVKK